MVRLVPIENDVIPIVLLVNMHLIKGTYFRLWPLIVIANSYNEARSKYKHTMCILRSISHLCQISLLLHQVKKTLIVSMNVPRSISQPRETISLSHKVEPR